MIKLHNTLTRQLDNFQPQLPGKVTLYTCGPTVYDYLHVGNWAAYIYWDILVRLLEYQQFEVTRVMNITDVGHLVSDADEGEDKLEKGAKRDGKTAWDVAKFYTDDFLAGMAQLNLKEPTHISKATDFIVEQLDLIRILKNKGYTYQIDDGIYFDTSKFPSYADFAKLDLDAQQAGARVEFNYAKRHPSDFALWKFSPANEKRDMEWQTPTDLLADDYRTAPARVMVGGTAPVSTNGSTTGADRPAGPEDTEKDGRERELATQSEKLGFPGWHLECSTMAMKLLGETLDIHTGGIDHIPVHHTNEIAQSEAATGKLFSRFWLHNNHIKVDGTKISKSLGNGYTLNDLANQGYTALDYRMFVLQSHYRSESNFTFANLAAARSRRLNWRNIAAIRHQLHATLSSNRNQSSNDKSRPLLPLNGALNEAVSNDLGTPQALKLIDEAFAELAAMPLKNINYRALTQLLETIDSLLGLDLMGTSPDISDDQKQAIIDRERAREQKDWSASDRIRDELEEQGISLNDAASGTFWSYKY